MILQSPAMRAAAGALALLTASAVAAADAFVFTAIPDQDSARLQERFGKIADYLSKQLGISVTYVPVKSYAASVARYPGSSLYQ